MKQYSFRLIPVYRVIRRVQASRPLPHIENLSSVSHRKLSRQEDINCTNNGNEEAEGAVSRENRRLYIGRNSLEIEPIPYLRTHPAFDTLQVFLIVIVSYGNLIVNIHMTGRDTFSLTIQLPLSR
jgi:hypothetical protein